MTIATVNSNQPDDDTPQSEAPLSMRELISSITAAAFGIRSDAGRERDFRHGSARQYIVAGLVATVVFILAVYAAVQLVLAMVQS